MVMLIIGIVSSLTVVLHTRSRERAMDKQAESILITIRAAQRTYSMEKSFYFAPGATNIGQLNQVLALDLINDGNWGNYNIIASNGFTASVRRNAGGYDRTWSINANSEDATCSGNCP